MSALSSKEAARSFSEVVSRARWGGQRTIITVRGKPAAVVVPYGDLAQLEQAPGVADVRNSPAGEDPSR